jgi:hypothetical protein
MIKKQTELVREKIALQWQRVSKKFKLTKNSKEVTNTDIQIALFQYASSGIVPNEYGEKQLEWLHEKLASLDKSDMEFLTLFYWEGKNLTEIGVHFGHTPNWASLEFKKILEKLRKS